MPKINDKAKNKPPAHIEAKARPWKITIISGSENLHLPITLINFLIVQ